MPRYRVLGPLLHDGVWYRPEGPEQALIVLADEAARALIAAGLIAPEPEAAAAAPARPNARARSSKT